MGICRVFTRFRHDLFDVSNLRTLRPSCCLLPLEASIPQKSEHPHDRMNEHLVEVPLLQPGWQIDWSALETALTGARALVLNSPHNPTGKVRSQTLRMCLRFCVKVALGFMYGSFRILLRSSVRNFCTDPEMRA